MRLEELINSHFDDLSKTDFAILNYIISNKSKVVDMPVEETAKEIFISTASLVRCAKKLGFSGFSEFKYFIKNELSEHEKSIETSTKILEQDISETIKLISQTNLLPICTAINHAKRIFIYGTDWGEKVAANNLVRNFMACDIFVTLIPSVTEMNWCIEKFNADDLVIIISFSGGSPTLKSVVRKLKIYDIPFISITPLSKNLLSSEAEFNLYYKFTDLNIDNNPTHEYNLFAPLNILIEMLFCYYYDNFHPEKKIL